MKTVRHIILGVAVWLCCGCSGPEVRSVPSIASPSVDRETLLWNLDELSQVPEMEWVDSTSAVRSLLFRSVDFEGAPTHVFGYYSDPSVLAGTEQPEEKRYAGVILLHGGGGAAFRMWVEKWAAEGYAALAIDLCGCGEGGVKLPDGGPSLSDNYRVFHLADSGDLRAMWSYHAVASAIKAHSLLLSFPAVDPERTCVTGISWGGYLTCIVGSLDDRFKAAAPVYGCGFYDELPFFAPGMMDRLSETGVQRWMKAFDPSAYLGYARIPFLFLTGNNDTAYQLYAYRKSCALVPDSLRTISIRPGMLHGHYEGWEPDEIRCFFDGVLNGGCPLVRVGKAVVTDSIRVPYDSRLSSLEGTFYFSNDTLSANADRAWSSIPGAIDTRRKLFVCPLPDEGYQIGFVLIRDMRRMAVSTGFFLKDSVKTKE